MNRLKIGLAGCLGRMGQDLIRAIHHDPHVEFTAGFEHPSHKDVGKVIEKILDLKIDKIVLDKNELVFKNSEVVIDFTTPESTMDNVKIAQKHKTPMVIGTTGLTKNNIQEIAIAGNHVPILQSANMSIGVNLLLKLVTDSSKILKEENYDVEILETHHRYKIDAPSGTALALGEKIAEGRGKNFDDIKVLDRTSKKSSRKIGEIGFGVTRAGEIAGEHSVNFISKNDRIELVHKANNRSIFVEGAISAAKWIVNQKPGIYSMSNFIGF